MTKKFPLLLVLTFVLIFAGATGASAQSTRGLTQGSAGLDVANNRAALRAEMVEQRQTRAEERLARADQRAASAAARQQERCETRQSAIVTRMNRLVALAENMLAVFETHSVRVQEFYTSTLIPAGITVSNYDDLLADIAAKEAIVQTELATAQASVDDFSCEVNDIGSLFTEYRENMQAVKIALHNYRTSIKNLIVAVRTAAEGLEEASPSPTPTPTPSPTPSPTI